MQNVIPLFLGLKFVSEILAIGPDIRVTESHKHSLRILSAAAFATKPFVRRKAAIRAGLHLHPQNRALPHRKGCFKVVTELLPAILGMKRMFERVCKTLQWLAESVSGSGMEPAFEGARERRDEHRIGSFFTPGIVVAHSAPG
jgi:hypothetical protein